MFPSFSFTNLCCLFSPSLSLLVPFLFLLVFLSVSPFLSTILFTLFLHFCSYFLCFFVSLFLSHVPFILTCYISLFFAFFLSPFHSGVSVFHGELVIFVCLQFHRVVLSIQETRVLALILKAAQTQTPVSRNRDVSGCSPPLLRSVSLPTLYIFLWYTICLLFRQTIYRPIIRLLVDNELECIYKETVISPCRNGDTVPVFA